MSCPRGACLAGRGRKLAVDGVGGVVMKNEKGLKLARTVRNQTLARLIIRRANLENVLTLTRLRSERPIRQPHDTKADPV